MIFISTSWRMGGTSLEWAIYHCYGGTEQCCEGFNIPRTSVPYHLPDGAKSRFLETYPDHARDDAGAVLFGLKLVDGSHLTHADRLWAQRSLQFISNLDGVVVAKLVNVPNLIPQFSHEYRWVVLARGFAGFHLSTAPRIPLTQHVMSPRALTSQPPELLELFSRVDRLTRARVIRSCRDAAFSKIWLAYTYHTYEAARIRAMPVFWLERRDVEVEALAGHIRGIMGPEVQSHLEDEIREPSGWFAKLGGVDGRPGWFLKGARYDPGLRAYYQGLGRRLAQECPQAGGEWQAVCRGLT
jgi:hypothetical protein